MADLVDLHTGEARSMDYGELAREAFFRCRTFDLTQLHHGDPARGDTLCDAVHVAMARGPVRLRFSARELVIVDAGAYDRMRAALAKAEEGQA